MGRSHSKAPDRAKRLFEWLFCDRPSEDSFRIISEGLSGSVSNAERLLSDVRLLVERERYSSARFLLTTAREEIAKSYILADMCRLDLSKQHSVLRKLCRAFYDHISKHAYLKLHELLKLHEIPIRKSMSAIRSIWANEIVRCWQGDPEDGEPDLPHNTAFDREFPLYMDYDNLADEWLVPVDSEEASHFKEMFHETPVSKTEKLIQPWHDANSNGLCEPKVLGILNSVFQKQYIGDNATCAQLERLYGQVADDIVADINIERDTFMNSPLVVWPLYHLV
jgi:AbiV family abortive infection protein